MFTIKTPKIDSDSMLNVPGTALIDTLEDKYGKKHRIDSCPGGKGNDELSLSEGVPFRPNLRRKGIIRRFFVPVRGLETKPLSGSTVSIYGGSGTID